MPRETVYGKTAALKEPATNVECWNFTSGARFDLPAGTLVRIEHAHDATHTVVCIDDGKGECPGIPLMNEGKEQLGYRFVVGNAQLARVTGLKVPRRTADVVGDIIRFESGEMDEDEARALLRRLKADGTLSGLQGHYQREARRLGVLPPIPPRSPAAVAADQATGCRESQPKGGQLYVAAGDEGRAVTDKEAARLFREGTEIEAPNAGAGSYAAVLERLGYKSCEAVETCSSAGDWTIRVRGALVCQRNRYPRHGFGYTLHKGARMEAA